MSKKVLVIGELNVDLILNQIDGFPKIGTEILSSDLTLTLGSSSAIFASNLSVQGVDVSFLGMIGMDQFGSLVLESLEKNNVNTEFIIQSQIHKTGVTIVMNYEMDRAMVTYAGAMNYLSISHIQEIDFTDIDHVHISSIFLQPMIKDKIEDILRFIKSKNITISLDPQWDPSEKWDLDLVTLLPLIDVFLPNVQEFLAITKTENVEDGIALINDNYNVIAIKQGEKGSKLFRSKAKVITKPAYLNENVVDCIGAGDSFDSGMIYGFINNYTLEESLNRGNIMGAANTIAAGGTTAFQNYEQTKNIIKEKFNCNID